MRSAIARAQARRERREKEKNRGRVSGTQPSLLGPVIKLGDEAMRARRVVIQPVFCDRNKSGLNRGRPLWENGLLLKGAASPRCEQSCALLPASFRLFALQRW